MTASLPAATARLLAPHLLSFATGRPTLLGSRCSTCDEPYFPAARGCTRCCGTDLAPCDLGARGRLWSWTVQDFQPKLPFDGGTPDGPFAPYGIGYVELDSGLKVESRLTVADPAQLRIGMPMVLTLLAYRHDADGTPLHTYAFAPEEPA